MEELNDVNNTCSKCGKTCKDKRGLSVHEARCSGINSFNCEACGGGPFQSCSHLKRHHGSCDKYKEKIVRQEFSSLEDKWKTKVQEKENHIQRLQENIKDTELSCSLRIDTISKEAKEETKTHLVEIENLKASLKALQEKYELLETKKENIIDQYLKTVNAQQCMLSQYYPSVNNSNNTTNHTYNNQQLVLQFFNYNDCSQKINPPDVTAYSIQEVVNLLFDSGFGNSIRMSDRSRGVIVWNNPEGELIRDSNGSQLSQHIMDCFESTMDTQREYLEQELRRLQSSEYPDDHQIDMNRQFLTFCRQFKEKDPNILEKLRKEISKRAKDLKDTSIDPIKQSKYQKIVTQLTKELFPNVDQWFGLSLEEFGKYISSKLSDYYWIEGASSGSEENKAYIVMRNDNKRASKVTTVHLGDILNLSVSSKILEERNQDVINRLTEVWFMEKNQSSSEEKYNQYTSLLKTIKQKEEKGLRSILTSMIEFKRK